METNECYVGFYCDCGTKQRGWFYGNSQTEDFLHCTCGKKYLVTRPYVVNLKDLVSKCDE